MEKTKQRGRNTKKGKSKQKSGIFHICGYGHNNGILPTMKKHTEQRAFCQLINGSENKTGKNANDCVG